MNQAIIIEFIIVTFLSVLTLKYKAYVLKQIDAEDVEGLALWISAIIIGIMTILVEKYVIEETPFFYNLIKSFFQ